MLDLLLRVDKFENSLSVFWNGCCPYDWFALLLQIVQEVIEILAFVDAQQSVELIQLFIEIVQSERSQQVALFVRGECVN